MYSQYDELEKSMSNEEIKEKLQLWLRRCMMKKKKNLAAEQMREIERVILLESCRYKVDGPYRQYGTFKTRYRT